MLYKNGRECIGEIEVPGKDKTTVRINEIRECESEPPVKVTLYQSVSKGERMDLTIQKAVELGVGRIVPVFSERCVVRPEKKDSKRERWQKIALEAARQSGRGIVPEVAEPMLFKDALKSASAASDLILIPWEEEKGETLKQRLRSEDRDKLSEIAVFIGPEGGFSGNEASMAKTNGAISVTLGKRILRTETAGPAVLAMILYEIEL